MAETKQSDKDNALISDLNEIADKLFRATQLRLPPSDADLMQSASNLMYDAADRLQALLPPEE